MTRWLRLVALLLCASSAYADPSIWKIDGRHNTVYLLGTMHLRQADQSLPANVQRVYQDSQKLWLEVDMQSLDPLAMQLAVVERGMLPAGETLDSLLDAGTRKQLAATAARMGTSPELFAPMRPWLAALTLEMSQYLQQGLSPTSGVDLQLGEQASRDGKPIHGLETLEYQLDLFAALSPQAELGFLKQTLQELNESRDEVVQLESAWLAGNDSAMEGYLDDAMQQDAALYTQLTTRRNQHWMTELKAALDTGNDNVLVAVGAMHLVGKNGLVALLKRAGYRVSKMH